MSFHQAMATIDRHLAGAAGLTVAKRAKYRAAAEKVIRAMGPKALERWNTNVQAITFYPDTESIVRFLAPCDPAWPMRLAFAVCASAIPHGPIFAACT